MFEGTDFNDGIQTREVSDEAKDRFNKFSINTLQMAYDDLGDIANPVGIHSALISILISHFCTLYGYDTAMHLLAEQSAMMKEKGLDSKKLLN